MRVRIGLLVLALAYVGSSPAFAQKQQDELYVAKIQRAAELIAANKVLAAQGVILESLELFPLRAEAHCLQGSLRRVLGDHSKALGNYRECEKRAAQNGQVLWQARALIATVDTLQYLALFGESIAEETALPPASEEQKMRLSAGRLADALSVYERIAKLAQRIPSLLPPALVKQRRDLLLAVSERRLTYQKFRSPIPEPEGSRNEEDL